MGRQKGDANRSKNRPSSSSTAASLLPTSTGLSVGFGGYLGSSRVDAIDDQEKDQQWDVDGEAALHLRRLSKKDATTRIKALKALMNIFNDWPASELCQLLPNWIFEYKRLIQDDSQQVRENTHNAMSAIAASVGRGLAPHLRTVMGAWWVSQFDPVREVSAAAQRSFQVAFQGQSKRLEALLYGANDIVTYIDGLLKLSPQTISEKSTPIEESTKKYELVISSALLALAAFLDIILHTKMLASSQSDELTEVEKGTSSEKRNPDKSRDVECIATTLCLNHKFFRDFTKSKSSQVRCASYEAVRALATNVPAILGPKDLDSMSVVVLGSFSDKDPICHVALWDMVIGVTKQCPEIWSTSSASKIAFPRLWAFLRHATYGSAKVSYPCLLPLLSLLPVQTVKPATEFFREFFVSLWEGYNGRSLVADDEMSFLEAVKECFIWIINNAERFAAYERAETIQSFMMENVLLELLWKGYVFSGVCVHGTLVKKHGKESQIGSRIITEERYSAQFLENLRICISDMISILADKSKALLCSFWTRFHDVCFEAVSIETGDTESIPSQGCTLRITKLMSDLGERSLSNDSQKAWLLSQVVRPLVAKIYHTVKTTEYPDAVRLLAKIVSVYGPLSFPVTDLCKTEPANEECNFEDEEEKSLLSISTFVRSELIPWCLDGSKSSCNEKIDLLLSFFEDTRLRTEWSSVLSFALQAGNGADEMSCNKVDVLALLLENFRLRFWDSEEIDYKGDASPLLVCWDLSGLDAVAVVIAGSPSLSDDSPLRFLRNVLGGFKENSAPPLVQRGTVESIFKILLQRMLHVLLNSEHDWAHYAASSILMPDLGSSHPAVQYEKALVLACAAAQAVCGSIFALQNVNNSDVVSKVVASFFCIRWAYNSLSNYREHIDHGIWDSSHGESSSESEEDDFTHHNVVPLLSSTQSEEISNMVTAISLVLCSGFCKQLIATTRFRILQMLIQCVRHAVCEGGTDTLEMMHACGKWVLALMDQLCTNAEDTQQLLDVLLEPTEVWPLFTRTPSQMNKIPMLLKDHDGYLAKEPGHEQFSAFVSKVALFIGWEKLVVPSMLLIPNGSQIAGKGKDVSPEEQCRIWLLIEMLCTWRWPGGSAVESIIPFLVSCTRSIAKNLGENIVISVVSSLFSSAVSKAWALEFNNKFWMGLNENMEDVEDPYLRALLACLSKMSAGGNTEFAHNTFKMLIIEQGFLEDTFSDSRSKVIPFILSILVPILRKGQEGSSSDVLNMGTGVSFEVVVCKWMDVAMSSPHSSSSSGAISDTRQLLQVIVACFPLHPAGGSAAIVAADSAQTTPKETEFLLDVLKKEISDGAVSGFVAHVAKQHASPQKGGDMDDIRLTHQEILAKLVTASVAYCWKDFKVDEWAVILSHLRAWLEAALLDAERFLQVVTDTLKEVESNNTRELSGSTLVDKVTVEIERAGCLKSDLSWTAVVLLSLVQALENSTLSDASSSLEALEMSDWKKVKQRVLSYVLRVFFATGMAESVALDWSAGESAGKAVAGSRLPDLDFWENVSEIVMSISNEERVEMARHLNIWTVGKDAVRALYALMFSSHAIGGLQHAAFSFLTGDPFQTSAVTYNDPSLQEDGAKEESVHTGLQATPSSSAKNLRHELALVLETTPANFFETSLVSPVRVKYFLAWAVLLSHLRSVSVSSQAGEQLVQYIQDKSLSSTLLDSIFQHIPLRTESGPSSRKRTSSGMWQAEVDRVGEAARRSCTLGSVSFAIEGLWPLEEGTMSVLAASLYGSMLKVLPACVRVWFTALRDRSAASLVEGFTTKYCSPLLVAEEFSQVHKSAIADDNLTIKANQSVGEVTVVYKKEEAGMDMVIRLPNSYPLRAVNIDCTRQLGISETRLRKWLLSMAAFLRNQNGAVAEAIQIWKQNVDGEFEGVEECPICYSIIHTANHSLPRLACRTCKHKFHAACLYKWFSTSHKSTCPLCQTPF